jgi:hypothetical protein
MAEYVELYIDQGAEFNTTIAISDDLTNVPGNLSNITVTGQIRKSLLSLNAYSSFVCNVVNASNGEMTISLDSANTANLKPGSYFYDIKLTDRFQASTRLIEGVVFVTPGITR